MCRFLPVLALGVTFSIGAVRGESIASGNSSSRAFSAGQEGSASPTANAQTNQKKEDDKPSSPDAPKADYSKEAVVVEQLHVRYQFENDGTGRKEQVIRVRVQSEAALQGWGQLRFGYNSAKERIEIPYVRVIKPDGSVVTAGADAVQELSEPIQRIAPIYTDYREKHVSVPGLRPGDVLEYQTVTVIHTALAPGQFWMQHDFHKAAIVLDEQLEIDLPAARSVTLKSKPGLEPKITEENGRRIYRWSTSHLAHEEDEKSDANSKDAVKKKKKKKPEDEIPAVQLTSFASWESGTLVCRIGERPPRALAGRARKGRSIDQGFANGYRQN